MRISKIKIAMLTAIFLALFPMFSMAGEKPVAVTTIFPLYDFLREVAGERADVVLLLPAGVEPHSYEPSPSDIATINAADIFFYTGETMEPWVSRLLPAITNQNLLIVEAAQSAGVSGEEKGRVIEKNSGLAEEAEEQGHHHGGADPHIWLDFEIDRKIVDAAADALATVDPDGKAEYLERARHYNERLSALDQEYSTGLRSCRSRTIIFGGHFAFGYLAKRYALEHVSPYAGFSPDAEPGARAVAELVTKVRSMGVKHVYYEELISPRLAEVISTEAGVTPVLLHAAHNLSADERTRGVTFVSIMEEDLSKLREGLGCL